MSASGSWSLHPKHNFNSIDACEQRCAACDKCQFVSFSASMQECSWFETCRLSRLLLSAGGETYTTRRSRVVHQTTEAQSIFRGESRRPTTIALQVSGHLGAECLIEPVARHVAACRSHFATCRVYVHTWSTLAPNTPHWSGRPRTGVNHDSSACVARLRERIAPDELVVEVQPPLSVEDSLDPDGKPFANLSTRQWGAQRHFGWRQNIKAMHMAAELRRASGRTHNAVVRLRPDGKEGINHVLDTRERESRLETLWGCIALTDAVASPVWKAGNVAARRFSSSVRGSLVSCNPTGVGFQGGLGDDNCFFGTPNGTRAPIRCPLPRVCCHCNSQWRPNAAVDAVLDTLYHNYTATWSAWRATKWPCHSGDEALPYLERQLRTAAALAGVKQAAPCREDMVYCAFQNRAVGGWCE